MSQPLTERISDELLRMEEDCTHSAKTHFNAQARWNRWNYLFGLPSVVISALAGTAFFKDYAAVAGVMTAVVTVLTALMTFLKPSERANAHKNSGDQYLSLRNDARVYRLIGLTMATEEEAAIAGMTGLTTRRNELNQASPPVSGRDFRKAKAGIDAGEAVHAVDRREEPA